MKREHKYRGKRIDNGQWIVGGLVISSRWRYYIVIDNIGIHDDFDHVNFMYVEIDPGTVGEYTGMKDMNGKEICAGDIIECFYMNLSYQQKGNYPPPNIEVEEYEVVRNVDVVKFEYGSFNFCGLPIGFDKLTGVECEPDYNTLSVRLKSIWDNNIDNIREEYPYLTVENFYNYNIIGNIHDNPELLETE